MSEPLDLVELLPTVHRLRDIERGGPLEALLAIVSEQARLVEADVANLWNDLFVETCADWVVPYIGDLIGNVPLHEAVRGRRADVARTISYRRRKGVVAMLEQLARDVTGWDAHAVEAMELLGWTQHVNHVRLQRADTPGIGGHVGPPAVDRVGTMHVRNRDVTSRLDGPFDATSHTVDVRVPRRTQGWYGIRKILLHLWRLEALALARTRAHRVDPADPLRYTFSSLGNPQPLFSALAPVSDETGIVTERNVGGPVRPVAFHVAPADWYGPDASFVVDGVGVGPVMCKDLSSWAAPPPDRVGIDVRLGRIMFGSGLAPASDPQVSYRYGFAARIGGGPYPRERRRTLPSGVRPRRDAPPDSVADPAAAGTVIRVASGGTPATLQAALAGWSGARTVIEIDDSDTYVLPATGLAIPAAPSGAVELVIQARNRTRPTLVGDLQIATTTLSRLVLDGLLIAGSVTVAGELPELVIRHCTLVPGVRLRADGSPDEPGTPSLSAAQPSSARAVRIEHSILGPIRMPAELTTLELSDSILLAPERAAPDARVALAANADGSAAGPATTILRSTVVGAVHVRELTLGSDSIFAAGALTCERRQAGCLRFCSFEPAGSRTPRRYRCEPDAAIEAAGPGADAALVRERVRPRFASLRYGEPSLCQLALDGPPEIAAGADDGSEMGVFSHLRQPQREANLRLRLDEYLPFGLVPGLIYVT